MGTVAVDILLNGLAAAVVIWLGKLLFVSHFQVPGLTPLFAAL